MSTPDAKFPKLETLPSNFTVVNETDSELFRVLCDGKPYDGRLHSDADRARLVTIREIEVKRAIEIVHGLDYGTAYSREQYESACAAIGITPEDESSDGFNTYGDQFGHFWVNNYEPEYVMRMDLRASRRRGIVEEKKQAHQRCLQQLADEGLEIDEYDREQYERACSIMGLTAHADADIERVAFNSLGIVCKLANRRNNSLPDSEKETCDNCGVIIWSGGMLASLGVACDPECYNALS